MCSETCTAHISLKIEFTKGQEKKTEYSNSDHRSTMNNTSPVNTHNNSYPKRKGARVSFSWLSKNLALVMLSDFYDLMIRIRGPGSTILIIQYFLCLRPYDCDLI